MGRPLLVATTNAAKLREVSLALADVPGLTLLSLRDVPSVPDLPEDESTFRGNAVLKAVESSRVFQGLALADDSGLCVDALGGGPGVRSARYGGPKLDDAGRCRRLLVELEGLPEARRGAQFECALALADRGRVVATFDGLVRGRILPAPRGSNGFGYDPVFYYDPAGKTFAEMPTAAKSAVSHRGQALSKLREFLGVRPNLLAV
ncbi:MAG: RdgB/HAM1 family non-canonical purine NTP pyrophosphatase [Acidobacteria bacterium]|nr:RdgB/HAM1 family non-canonical purine NTP pyrophosphatase [Acidobacteriota bacterium]